MIRGAKLAYLIGVFALAAVLGAGLTTPRPALAHAEFISSSPTPGSIVARAPAEVRAYFSEKVEPRFSSIRVFDTAGQRMDSGPARVDSLDARALTVALAPLGDGVYTVSWQALSAVDGHTSTGSFSFAVGRSDLAAQLSGTTPPAASAPSGSRVEVFLRFLLFASVATVCGAILFHYLVWRPAARATRWQASAAPATDVVARWAALSLLVAALGIVALRLSSGAGALVETRVGLLLLVRLGLAAGLAASAWYAPSTGRARLSLVLAAAMGIMLTISLSSHSAALARPPALGVLLEFIHLTAMAAWAGGLLSLLLFLSTRLRQLSERERPRLLKRLVPRFSLLAGSAVGLLVATGAYSALTIDRHPQALVSSAHGWNLTAKVALVALVLGFAAVNLLVMRPRLGRTGPRAAFWQRAFRVLVGAETAGVALVLLATGVLTTVSPPSVVGKSGPSVQSTLAVEGAHVTLRVSPGQVGLNQLQVELDDDKGRPVPADRVLLKLSYKEQDLGESILVLPEATPGRFEGAGFLGLPGTWSVTVAAQAPSLPDSEAAFRISLPSAGQPSLTPAPTGAAIDAGRRLYGQLCARCHGISGFGDGPDAIGLQPPPLNLNVHVPYHGDQQLFRFIADGVAGTAMPVWRSSLREDQIWALVYYLRATFKEEEQ